MSDTRAAIRELRSLSEKRSTQGLTEQERGRLAELRERLGLPSEPSEARTDGTQPVGTAAPARPAAPTPTPQAPRIAVPSGPAAPPPPTQPAPLPRLDAPEPAALPTLEMGAPEPAVELPGTDATVAVEALAPAPELSTTTILPDLEPERPTEPGRALASEVSPATTLPPLEPPTFTAEPAPVPLAEVTSDATTDPAIEMRAFAEATTPSMEPELEALPAVEPGTSLRNLEAQDQLQPLPPAAEPADAPLPSEEAWAGEQAAAEEPGAAVLELLPSAEPAPVAPEAPLESLPAEPEPSTPPRRLTLAERIDAAAVEAAQDASPAVEPEAPAWGAVLVPPEPLIPEDLGATPLDLADPAAEFAGPDDGAPIELSSADVVLLEAEPPAEPELGGEPADPLPLAALHEFVGAQPEDREPELGGEPADPLPLAALHEFVGAQPEDPRALAFDDQGDAPTFAPEELQATEAELAAEPQTFQQAPLEEVPDLEPEPAPPPPAPAAPRIVLPRPPPPSRPVVAAAPETRPAPVPPKRPAAPAVQSPRSAQAATAPPPASPPEASPARRIPPAPTGGGAARASVPPPPPAAAYVLGDDGRRLPVLAAAVPEPPQLAHQFGRSGPFGRPQALLLTPAPLDVMDGAEELPPEPTPMPATDVATGSEVFGQTYLSPTFVEGEHRVVLHTLEGQVRRGTVKDLDLLDPVIRLAQPGRPPEAIAAERVKAIFFMQEPGTAPLPSAGRRIRVGFADGRQIVGFSEDVDAGEQGFFLVPADTRTHTARIYVFRAGIASITAA